MGILVKYDPILDFISFFFQLFYFNVNQLTNNGSQSELIISIVM